MHTLESKHHDRIDLARHRPTGNHRARPASIISRRAAAGRPDAPTDALRRHTGIRAAPRLAAPAAGCRDDQGMLDDTDAPRLGVGVTDDATAPGRRRMGLSLSRRRHRHGDGSPRRPVAICEVRCSRPPYPDESRNRVRTRETGCCYRVSGRVICSKFSTYLPFMPIILSISKRRTMSMR